MTTLIVNLIGLILIGLIIWWFIFSKPKATRIKGNTIDIKVHDGIYEPSVIKAKKGQSLHLRFLREDESPCSEVVISTSALNYPLENLMMSINFTPN